MLINTLGSSPASSVTSETRPLLAKKQQPSSPGLQMAGWTLREYTRLVVSPATPGEVAQRSRILHTVGAVAAALVGCVLVCTAIAFPPAAIAGGVLGAAAFMASIAIVRHGFVVQKRLETAELARQARARAFAPPQMPQMDDETLANIEQVDEMLAAEAIGVATAIGAADDAEDAVRQVSQHLSDASLASSPLLVRSDSNASFISSLSRQSSVASFHSSADSEASDITHSSDITDEHDVMEHLDLETAHGQLAARIPNMASIERIAAKYDIEIRVIGPTDDGLRRLGVVGKPEDPESFAVHLWLDDHGFRALSRGIAIGEPTGIEGAVIHAMIQSNKVPPQNPQAIIAALKADLARNAEGMVAGAAA